MHKRHSFAKFSSLCSHGCCGHAYIVDERHHGSWWSHPERSSVEGHFSQMIINCKYPNQPNTREVSTSRQFCARKTTASLKATSSIFQTFSNCIKFTARPNPGGYTIGSDPSKANPQMRPTAVRRNLLHAVKPKGAGWLPKPYHVFTEFTDDQQSEDDLEFLF